MMLICAVSVLALQVWSPQGRESDLEKRRACVSEMNDAIQGMAKKSASCHGLNMGEVTIRDEVDRFLAGEDSLIGDWAMWIDRFGKLDAVLERLRTRAAFRSADGYGKAKWGDSIPTVRKAYPKAKTAPGGLIMDSTIADMPVKVSFLFAAGKLTVVRVAFAKEHSSLNPDGYVIDYRAVSSLLQEKYGDPEVDEPEGMEDSTTLDELYESVGGEGRAVRRGTLRLTRSWTANQTKMVLSLRSDGSKLHHTLTYLSTELAELTDTVEKARLLKDL